MRLVAFTIRRFRSITAAHRLPLSDSTILIGPNNEGKSNILRALVMALQILNKWRFEKTKIPARWLRDSYRWSRDFPLRLQGGKGDQKTVFRLEFELTDEEIADFRCQVRSNLNGTLPIEFALDETTVNVKVAKKGPGAATLSRKSARIATFVGERFDFEYIAAIRTAEAAEEVVAEMLQRELAAAERDPDFIAAIDKIAELQQPILNQLSESIKETLVQFLPAVTDVQVGIPRAYRLRAMYRGCTVTVDDGTPTELQYKGDGVQSLAALGIMRHASDRGARGRNLLIAIEEPESHLHPKAIHELRAVLGELAQKHQVVITTHCPAFVNRRQVRANILVNNSKARPAKNVAEIRDALGVRASDNLRHAELVLIVEGREDKLALDALLRHRSSPIAAALDNGTLAVDTLNGASNLSYKVGLVREALCSCHVLLDDDGAGRKAFERAHNEGMLDQGDVNFTICEGTDSAELEDLYTADLYRQAIEARYRVSLLHPKFKTKKPWAKRMAETFRGQGKQWNDRVEGEVKGMVAELVASSPSHALEPSRRSAFDGLVRSLEYRLLDEQQ